MKITLFLLLFVTFQAYCENGYSQSAKISIPRSTLKVSELLTQIESQTDYLFVYNKKSVDTKRVVNVDATNQPVSEILDKAYHWRQCRGKRYDEWYNHRFGWQLYFESAKRRYH